MKFKSDKLEARILKKFRTLKNFANYLCLPEGHIRKLLDGDASFSELEIHLFSAALGVKFSEMKELFFTPC